MAPENRVFPWVVEVQMANHEATPALARIIREGRVSLCLPAIIRFNVPVMSGLAAANQEGSLADGQFARDF